jgi:AGZA family xanthine/uracil permease-like MFS transporter
MLERFFALNARGTRLEREAVAGLTTFLTMAYVMFVNPQILATTGMDTGAVFVATCLAAAFGSLVMGLYANLPIALAPGMGLNAYFAFLVAPQFHGNWRLALGCVLLSGICAVAISASPLRNWFINAIPQSLKLAMAAGIGFFLALIGFENAGLVKASPTTLLEAGNFADPKLWIATTSFVVIAALAIHRVRAAILIGILGATLAAAGAGLTEIRGIASFPPPLTPTFLEMDLAGAVALGPIVIVFTFLLVDLLDTSGTLTAVAHQAGILDAAGRLPNARRALIADSSATVIGALLGTSSTTSYIESAAGVQAGGRTGLTAVVVAGLFLLSLFFAPLAGAVPTFATAPALIFVAALMARGLVEIDWNDLSEATPALVTALAIPFTFSIASGIGLGFIAYTAIKILSGRGRDVSLAVAAIAVLFAVKLALQTGG